MLSYCLKCRKNTASKKLKVVRKNKGKIMISLKYAVCDSAESKFIKKQEAEELLSMIKRLLCYYYNDR